MSETASFVDPVFLGHFGLGRVNVLDYFLHPLNPFRSKGGVVTSNEELSMQRLSVGTLMQYGTGNRPGPLTLAEAEEEYSACLSKLTGEQYELMPTDDEAAMNPLTPPPLFTLRHVLRTNANTVKVLGIYYVVEGVIYRSPSVRSLMKSNVTRTLETLTEACDALSVCARYEPSTGYTWHFEDDEDNDSDRDQDHDDDDDDHQWKPSSSSRKKRRRILDNRRPGERTDEEEEGIRASEAIDRILVRISKGPLLKKQRKA